MSPKWQKKSRFSKKTFSKYRLNDLENDDKFGLLYELPTRSVIGPEIIPVKQNMKHRMILSA